MSDKYENLKVGHRISSQGCWFDGDMGLHHVYSESHTGVVAKAATVWFLLVAIVGTIVYVLFGG